MSDPTVTTPTITDDQVANLKEEALVPELSTDEVMLGDRKCQVRFAPFKIERQVVSLLKPHLGQLGKLEEGGTESLASFADTAADLLPKLVALAYGHAGITEEWLAENAHSMQMLRAMDAQLKKNGMADLLGNIWRPAGRGA